MRVLITGGSGFTGQYLSNQLTQAGHEVKSLASNLSEINDLEVELGNFKPNSVVHLAGISSVLHKSANDFYNVNLIGTRNLLSAISGSRSSIDSIILASTAHIYDTNHNGPISETGAVNPGSDYAVSKYAMERMAKLWSESLPIVVTRPFNYTGVGQTTNFVIPKIVSHFKNKELEIQLGNTSLFREFGDVRDVADIYAMMVERPPIGEVLNICTGQYHKLDDIIKLCSEISLHQLNVKTNADFLRPGEPEKVFGDCSKLTKYFPEIQFRGMQSTLSWMFNDI